MMDNTRRCLSDILVQVQESYCSTESKQTSMGACNAEDLSKYLCLPAFLLVGILTHSTSLTAQRAQLLQQERSLSTTSTTSTTLPAMFFCSISGEPPQDPVVSSKSGHVYERRLILKYITENGTDPITGEKLEESDLITVKASAYLYALIAT